MFKIIYITGRRFLELVIPECLLSAVFYAVFNFDILPSITWIVVAVVFLMLAIYFVMNAFMLRACYCGCENNADYLIVNFTANILFLLINIGLYIILSDANYTKLFSVFKAFRYLNCGTLISAIIIHTMLILIIFAAPFGLERTPEEVILTGEEKLGPF